MSPEVELYREYLLAIRIAKAAHEMLGKGEEEIGGELMIRAFDLGEKFQTRPDLIGNTVEFRIAMATGRRKRARRLAKKLGLPRLP